MSKAKTGAWAALLLVTASSAAWGAPSPSQYDEMIRRARAGIYAPALAMLRQLAHERPHDMRAVADHIIVATWAGRDREAIETYESTSPHPVALPAAAQAALARAYRNEKEWDKALAAYDEGVQRFPRDTTLALGKVMVLGEIGREKEGIALGRKLVAEAPSEPDRRLALSYVHRLNGDTYAALEEASQAHKLAPDRDDLTRHYILALEHARMSEAALRVAREHKGLMSPSEMRRLEADYAAELSRLAAMPSRLDSERYAIADKALAEYDRLIPEWEKQGPQAQRDVLRLRMDRIQALNARNRMQDVVDAYEQLQAEGHEIPDYVLDDVAAAYLALRQPQKARDIYREVISQDEHRNQPASEQVDDRIGLFYSLIESEEFDEAHQLIEQTEKDQPVWRYIKGVPQRVPNDTHLYTAQTAVLDAYYTDDTVTAQRRLESMVARAPNNNRLRVSLANLYRDRAQPRRSERELKMAETLAPRSLDLIRSQARTAMALQEWEQARLLVDDARARSPENPDTRDLVEDWNNHLRPEVRISGTVGIASDSPVAGNGDLGIETVVYSSPIHENWRAFGGAGYAMGDFEEGRGHYRWVRGGAEWRGRDLNAEMEVSSQNYGHGTKAGARIEAEYEMNDHWQLGASGALHSRETPLRALTNDISSNSVSAFVRWRGDERREWKFSVEPSRFSDGNKRIVATVAGSQRIYTSPRVKANLGLGISASHNSMDDVPYFSPRSDLEIVPTLNIDHLIYRHYNTHLQQSFTLGAGSYSQKGHGTGLIGMLGYGLRYQIHKKAEMGFTATGISRPYDGEREMDVQLMFDMGFRF